MNCLILMMGGSGVRYGASIPKQYIETDGVPVFVYTLKKYLDGRIIDKVVIVSNTEWMDYTYEKAVKILQNKLAGVVAGGRTRAHSVKCGLEYCTQFMRENDIVLIHDATNPCVDINAVQEAIQAASVDNAAVVGTNQFHTIYQKDDKGYIEKCIPRETVSSGYSPEIFRFHFIYSYYINADENELVEMTSTVALLLRNNIKVKCIPTKLINIKITYPQDMDAFIALKRYEEKH